MILLVLLCANDDVYYRRALSDGGCGYILFFVHLDVHILLSEANKHT